MAQPVQAKNACQPQPKKAAEKPVQAAEAQMRPCNTGMVTAQGTRIPTHMSKPIVLDDTGPAFRAAGLRRPVGSKPLHPVQPTV